MTEPLAGVIVSPGTGPSAVELAPHPLLRTVGDIPGLTPRYERGDGGEVPLAHVTRVDALPEREWNLAAAWLRKQKQASTRRTYLADLYGFLAWCDLELAGLSLLEVNEDVLVHYRDTIGTGERALAPATITRRISALSSLLEYGRRRKVLDHNAAKDVDRPDVGDVGTTPALSRDQAEALLAGCEAIAEEHPLDAACAALMVGVVLRVGEIVALAVGAVTTSSGYCVLVFTRKGGKTATCPVPPRVCTLLDSIIDGRPAREMIFVHEDGKPWDRFRARTALRRAARAAGVPASNLHPHMLRATGATLLLDAGVPLRDVQELLGHERPETTRRYDRGGKRLEGHAVFRLASILGGGS